MKPNSIKKLLFSEIKSVSNRFADFCMSAGKDFTRNRKISFETVLKTIIGMESSSLTNDLSSYYPGTNGQKPYNLLHLNALLDLKHKIYADAVIQGRMDWDEHNALQEMIDRSNIRKALVIADCGYESYNNMAHIQEKSFRSLLKWAVMKM